MGFPHLDLAANAHDRAGERRVDDDWLDARWADPKTRVLVVAGTRIRPVDGAIPWVAPDEAPYAGRRVLLGERDGRAWFALIVDPGDAPGERGEWVGLRAVLPRLAGSGGSGTDVSEAPLVFHAVGMAEWHWATRFCPWCGGRLEPRLAGAELVCADCGKAQFPRTDPAVIMAVTHGEPGSEGEALLLGRQEAWPSGRYSTLAGFLEPGETLEDAVRREVWEEVGVRVGEVTYFGNQPWPLPASLMLGFLARAETREIHVDGKEIEDARWFTRAQMREEAERAEVVLPGGVSISRSLVEHWYGGPLPGELVNVAESATSQPTATGRWHALLECMVDRNVSRLLLIVGARSATDVALFLATSVVAFDIGGPAAVGLVGAVRVLPSMVTAGSAALVADRVRRPLVIAGVNACFVLVALALAAGVWLDLGLVYLVLVQGAGSLVSGLIKPSMQALLPQLVGEPRRLLPANSAWGLIDAIGGVAGPAAATALLFTAGPESVFIALAVVYAVTAWLAVSIQSPFQPPSHPAHRRSFWRDSVGGVSLFMHRGGRAHFAVFLTQRLLSGLVTAFVILYAHEVAGADGDSASGTLLAALGVGAFVGSAAAMVTHGHGRVWFVAGSVLTSLPLALVGLTQAIPVAAALLVVSGAGAALAGTHGATLLNRWLPDHVAGRAWGALFGVGAATAAIGSIAAPALSDWLGTNDAMVPVGLAAALVPLVCAPGLRFLESSVTPRPEALAVVQRTEVLSALPKVCLERLAAAAVVREVGVGDVVVRQGDVGDEFYMVESGQLQVTQDGHDVRTLGPGDSFGEVALLHSIPRTATVVAVTPGSVLSLDHEIFVATISGHAPTEDWAEGAVAGLLAEDADRTARVRSTD